MYQNPNDFYLRQPYQQTFNFPPQQPQIRANWVSSVVKEEGDMYDLDVLVKTIKGVFADDSYSIVLPKIPMFAPKDCIIKIDSADIDKIVSYIQPVSVA